MLSALSLPTEEDQSFAEIIELGDKAALLMVRNPPAMDDISWKVPWKMGIMCADLNSTLELPKMEIGAKENCVSFDVDDGIGKLTVCNWETCVAPT